MLLHAEAARLRLYMNVTVKRTNMPLPYPLPAGGAQRARIDWAIVAFWLAYFGLYLEVVLFLVQ